jgi:hypothetical protein
MNKYDWTVVPGGQEDALASGRMSAELSAQVTGMGKWSLSARRDVALAELMGRSFNAAFFALADAATIVVDASLGDIGTVTLGGNRTMGAPSNPVTGQRLGFTITQDGTGGRTLAWNAVFKVSWSETGNTLGKISSIEFVYNGTNWTQVGGQATYA